MYGLLSALASAVLFGAATPAAKRLLLDLTAFQLAGLLYLGAAIGIAPGALWQRGDRPPLDAMNRRRLASSGGRSPRCQRAPDRKSTRLNSSHSSSSYAVFRLKKKT